MKNKSKLNAGTSFQENFFQQRRKKIKEQKFSY